MTRIAMHKPIAFIHGFMHGRATHMPRTWPDGTLRSHGGPFAAAYFVPGVPGTYTAPSKPGVKPALVLNTAGRPQATLARATTSNIRLDPAKTVEQLCVSAIRESQLNRPLRAGKREKVAA